MKRKEIIEIKSSIEYDYINYTQQIKKCFLEKNIKKAQKKYVFFIL